MSKQISRRTILLGMGAAVALPALEAMSLPAFAKDASRTPLRMAFFSIPNGVNNIHWFPKDIGRTFVLPKTLSPLESVREDLLVISGLAHDKARANGDGPGDHARASATLLTG